MTQASPNYQESDEDVKEYILSLVAFDPKFIEKVKTEYKQALNDKNWDWIEANSQSEFIGKGEGLTAEEIHTAFKEKIWEFLNLQ